MSSITSKFWSNAIVDWVCRIYWGILAAAKRTFWLSDQKIHGSSSLARRIKGTSSAPDIVSVCHSPRQDPRCLAGWTTSSCDMLHQDPKSMCTGCTPKMAQSSMFVALIRKESPYFNHQAAPCLLLTEYRRLHSSGALSKLLRLTKDGSSMQVTTSSTL